MILSLVIFKNLATISKTSHSIERFRWLLRNSNVFEEHCCMKRCDPKSRQEDDDDDELFLWYG